MSNLAGGNLHSRLVGVLKLVLPLIALVLLSTLFIFSHKINPEDAIPYADVDIEDRLRDPKMTDAGYSGMTADGSAISLSALEAKPTTDGGSLKQISGTLTANSGAKTELSANSVTFDTSSKTIKLRGGAELRSPSGYTITAKGLNIATDRTYVQSQGSVTAVGPLGKLSADELVLSQDGETGPYLLVFKGKVRLIYQSQQ